MAAGLVAWGLVLGAILAAGLLTGVWRVADISAHADDIVPSFGVLTLVGTLVLVGGPVTLYIRTGLVTPFVGLVLYFAAWALYGVTSGFGGVRSLYVAFAYGPFVLVGYLVVGGVEYVLRSLDPGRDVRPDGGAG